MYRQLDASAPKKRTRDSEIALLEKLSGSLDTYITENPSEENPKRRKWKSAADLSKHAAKNFLAAKTLVRTIAKALAQENVEISGVVGGEFDPMIVAFVEEFNERYPSLTKQGLLDGIVRYNEQNGTSFDEGTVANDQKFEHIKRMVYDEMQQYHEKIERLKRSREAAAEAEAEAGASPQPRRGRPKKYNETGGEKPTQSSPNKRGRPSKNSPENRLKEKILERYVVLREKHDRLPNGVFYDLVEETKSDLKLKHVHLDLDKLEKGIRYRYNNLVKKGEVTEVSSHKAVYEECYARYQRTKIANGGKLQPGTLAKIVDGVKLEYGMPDIKYTNMKQKIQSRFSKEHPEFDSGGVDGSGKKAKTKIGELSEQDQKRRQLLLNEVTARYVSEKEAQGKKKLPDGTLDRIIQQTKNDLGIHNIDVHKTSIRGRLTRKSLHVQTLGKGSPYDAIDEPLVETINSWLGQGISVTRAQGLNLANQLLKGKKMERDETGDAIVLDAKWWRNFLERNKRRLVCAGN